MQPIASIYTLLRRWVLAGTLLAYITGIIWLLIPAMRQGTLALTPYILLLSMTALLLNQHHYHEWHIKAIAFYWGGTLLTFITEVVGVNSGLPFGAYSYGKTLGVQLWHTPLVIGCNWMVLLLALRDIASQYNLRGTNRVVVTTLLMVAYDLVLEQVAPLMDMWQFEGGVAPLRNYLSWGIISLLLLFWGERALPNSPSNRAAIPLLTLQLLLFITQIIRYRYAS